MHLGQFTVLTRPRPTRAAFLVDIDKYLPGSERLNAVLDAIVECNNTRWGGRTNHVGFIAGGKLDEYGWGLLEISDPDLLVTFARLEDNLLSELDERVNPWSIQVEDHTQTDLEQIGVSIEGVAVPPTAENLRRIRALYSISFRQEEKLLMFEFAEGYDPEVRRFVHRNFGTYYQWFQHPDKKVRRIAWLEQLLPHIPTQIITVGDTDSLAGALTMIAGRIRPRNSRPALQFIAPNQLASISLESWPMGELNKTYQLIVGDSPRDFGEYWNGVRRKNNWAETHKHQLWISEKLAAATAFRESLHDWLFRYTNYGGGDRIELLTYSLSKEKIEEFCSFFRKHELPIHIVVVTPDQITERQQRATEEANKRNRFIPWVSNGDATRFTCSSQNETLSLPKPDPLKGENQNGSWSADILIEHISPLRNSAREQSWWQLPRRNCRGVANEIFRKPARITREGCFSVKMESQDARVGLGRGVKPELAFALPSDAGLIYRTITQPYGNPLLTPDPKGKFLDARSPIHECRISTKGAYLAGLIELFGNFWTAKSFCERRFWRFLFSTLAGYGQAIDERLQQNIVGLLKAHLMGEDEARQSQAVSLADEILHLVRGRLKGHYVGFKDCLRERSRLEKQGLPETLVYPQGNTVVHHAGEQPLTFDQMREGLDQLLELGVLRLGIESACPQCNLVSWYHVDEIKQRVVCAGCGTHYALRSTELWSYALNSLAQMSVSQGVLAVLHSLTAIASHSHSFFAFSPSLDLFRKDETKPWHEIDVSCVANGEFVIGEVKEGFIQKNAFDELAEIAEALQPQRAVIFLPLENANKQSSEITGWLKDMQIRLEPKKIKAEIFTLPSF